MAGEPPAPQGDAFSLFDNEDRMLAEADAMVRRLHEVADGVQGLADAYRRSCREQQRLVRLSDRMQHELQVTKRELAEQAKNLKLLNETLQSEVEQRRRLSDELFRIATTDQLTGAVSRRHLFELGNYELARAKRSGAAVTALLIDLDHFKRVNDAHGHLVGDEVLKRFAEICRTVTRTTDIFARYGGEEFVVLLPDTNAQLAGEIAARLLDALAGARIEFGSAQLRITASIGLAALQPEDAELEHLLLRADAALYEAKRAGRNRVVAAGAQDVPEPAAIGSGNAQE